MASCAEPGSEGYETAIPARSEYHIIPDRDSGIGSMEAEFSKEEKQDLMHIAVCRLLAYDGYFEFAGRDEDGWPHYRQVLEMPAQNTISQEKMLKTYAVKYFKEWESE